MQFPEDVVKRTLIHLKDNRNDDLVSINVLEFVTVIINYLMSLHVVRTEQVTDDPHPILLNYTDNTSALNWTLHACKSSDIGRRLGRFFCSLLIDSPLGINAKWIKTTDNDVADDISRLKRISKSNLPNHISHFDYSTLQQKHPELQACRFF